MPRVQADAIERALRAHGDPARAKQEQRYLKSDLAFLGAGVPATRRAVKAFVAEHGPLSRDALWALVDELWGRGVHELKLAAVELCVASVADLGPEDLPAVERLLRDARTWALVDPLAVGVAGPIVEGDTRANRVLDRWIEDDDFWIQRAAMLALLGPLRRGEGDFTRFGRYADRLLDEPEFFLRKAIGWILRDTGRKRPELVFAWLLPRARRASGVTFREVIKILDDRQVATLHRRRAPRPRKARTTS